jgi:hypothetical protein
VVGEVGGEEEREALGRREGNMMGDGEDVIALWYEENALGDEEDASGNDDDTTPWEEDTSSDSEATSPSSKISDKEANRSPASTCAPNSNSCFTKSGQVYTCTRYRQRSRIKRGRLERRMQRALELRSCKALRSIANRTLRKNIPNRTPRTLIHSSNIH